MDVAAAPKVEIAKKYYISSCRCYKTDGCWWLVAVIVDVANVVMIAIREEQ